MNLSHRNGSFEQNEKVIEIAFLAREVSTYVLLKNLYSRIGNQKRAKFGLVRSFWTSPKGNFFEKIVFHQKDKKRIHFSLIFSDMCPLELDIIRERFSG